MQLMGAKRWGGQQLYSGLPRAQVGWSPPLLCCAPQDHKTLYYDVDLFLFYVM